MISRRDFLSSTAAFTLSGLALPQLAEANGLYKIPKEYGLQLFTLFNVIDEDVKGSLQKVANVGFKEIESAFSRKGGFYGLKPKEFATLIKDLGMEWRSHHAMGAPFRPRPGFDTSKMPKMPTLKETPQEIIDSVAEGGVKYLVCASIPIGGKEEVTMAVDILSKAGELAKKSGIQLVYHNHDKEFEEIDGQKAYDVFLSQISPDLMKMELDLAWASKAGVDIPKLFKENKGRFPLFHVKDIDKEGKKPQVVGEGVVDFKSIFAHAKNAGVKHLFIEQDMPPSPFENIATSYANLQKILGR